MWRRVVATLHDLVMIPVAWFGAYWLRFNLSEIPQPFLDQAIGVLPIVILVQGGAYWYFGLYRGIWRFASLPDLVRIMKAVFWGAVIALTVVALMTRLEDVPRSVFPLYALLLLCLLGGPRLAYRWFKDQGLGYSTGTRVLIVGAGQAGEMLARELMRNRMKGYDPVGFVDDSPKRLGKEIRGLRVLGNGDAIPELVGRYAIDLVMIAIPSASSRDMRRIVGECEAAGVPFRTLPAVQDIVSGRAVLQTLRQVSIEDLLGREPVSLDWSAIHEELDGKTILVSGGGGSIGSELCRQIAKLRPRRLIVVDNCEYSLYRIGMELSETYPELDLYSYLGDITDVSAVSHLMKTHRPEVIFHAAAYKHVPLLEDLGREAVRNNALGTRTLAAAAHEHGCETFVLISTDKAVNPENVMGASKRAAELYCQNLDRHSKTRFITVRFGNVLGSRGSVVPMFQEQIEHGGPVTVTHPEVTRYFMTIAEASQLITQASAMGEGGEIYVLDMGEPVRIGYLAEQMIRLAGKIPGQDIEIVYTGLRPGEKLHEELFHEKELLSGTAHEKILLAKFREVKWEALEERFEQLVGAIDRYDGKEIERLLRELVPEYKIREAADGKIIPLERARERSAH